MVQHEDMTLIKWKLFELVLESFSNYYERNLTNLMTMSGAYAYNLDWEPINSVFVHAARQALPMYDCLNSDDCIPLLSHMSRALKISIQTHIQQPYFQNSRPIMHNFVTHLVRNIIEEYEINLYDLYIPLNHNARIIQNAWRNCVTDPQHKVCRKRLLHEFDDLGSHPIVF